MPTSLKHVYLFYSLHFLFLSYFATYTSRNFRRSVSLFVLFVSKPLLGAIEQLKNTRVADERVAEWITTKITNWGGRQEEGRREERVRRKSFRASGLRGLNLYTIMGLFCKKDFRSIVPKGVKLLRRMLFYNDSLSA